jgi:alkanesulfonate monooxygenase SsuD/methylene tetrahydromethanopterin reductase-like flavin-dependent oxidoreductase (luciferase family)
MEAGILLGDVRGDIPPTAQIDLLLAQVDAGQRAGFSHFFIGQHFLYGGYSWPQPIPLLARVAAETDPHVTLGTGVLLAPLYHPVVLAEELATLDAVCRGRLVVGIGAGYRRVEFQSIDVPFEERVERLEESVAVLRAMWGGSESVTHHGRHFQLEGVTPHLRPVRPGGPPLWIGARSRAAVLRAARLGDAWLGTSKVPFDELRLRWGQYRDERQRLGRAVHTLPANRFVVPGASQARALARYHDMTGERLDAYVEQGLSIEGGVVGETRDATQMAFLGRPEQIVDRIRKVVAEIPIDPLFVRVSWPSMDAGAVMSYIEELGREILPALQGLNVGDAAG